MIRSSVKYVIWMFLLLFFKPAAAQNMSVNGKFNTHYFSVDDFGSAGQIWAGAQGSDGNVYFGNRQDILVYNGIEWNKIKTASTGKGKKYSDVAHESMTREIYRASDDVLYVGRENNFGYIAYNDSGAPNYYPLFAKKGTNEPGNFWNIYELSGQRILFVGENALYTVKQKKIEQKLEIPEQFKGFSCKTSSRFGKGFLLIYQKGTDDGKRITKYLFIDALTAKMKELKLPENIRLRNIRGSFEINGIWYLLDISGDFYSAKPENGGYVWNTEKESLFPEMRGASPNYIRRDGNFLFMGTETQGLLISDLEGHIIRRIDFYDGLENLYVFKLFHDANTHRSFATNAAMQQDVYDLETFTTSKGKRTLVIAYNGVYEYFPSNNSTKFLSPSYAYSLCQDPNNKDIVYLTLEAGIAQLKLLPNGSWEYKALYIPKNGSPFSLTVLNGKIYFGVTDVGLGIYDVKTKKTRFIKEVNPKKGESCSYYVEKFQGEIVIETTGGIAILSEDERSMKAISQNKEFFGDTKNDLHRIININDEQLWVVVYRDLTDGKFEIVTGWLEKHGKNNWKWIKWPLAGMRKAGIVSSIVQGPDNEIWLGASNGIYVVNFDAIRKYRNHLTVSIDRFEAGGKTLRFNVFRAKKLEPLTYGQNSFSVTFHANSYSGKDHMEYRYKLEGFNDEWSDWSDQYYKDFQKIGEGTYVLKLQARNGFGIESEVLEYEITILPPWYRTIWAYILYLIALIVLVFVIVQLSTQRVKRQNQRLDR